MDLTDFNYNYLNYLLKKVSKEQETVPLLGDFCINLSSYNDHNLANKFLKFSCLKIFLPYIL